MQFKTTGVSTVCCLKKMKVKFFKFINWNKEEEEKKPQGSLMPLGKTGWPKSSELPDELL